MNEIPRLSYFCFNKLYETKEGLERALYFLENSYLNIPEGTLLYFLSKILFNIITKYSYLKINFEEIINEKLLVERNITIDCVKNFKSLTFKQKYFILRFIYNNINGQYARYVYIPPFSYSYFLKNYCVNDTEVDMIKFNHDVITYKFKNKFDDNFMLVKISIDNFDLFHKFITHVNIDYINLKDFLIYIIKLILSEL